MVPLVINSIWMLYKMYAVGIVLSSIITSVGITCFVTVISARSKTSSFISTILNYDIKKLPGSLTREISQGVNEFKLLTSVAWK